MAGHEPLYFMRGIIMIASLDWARMFRSIHLSLGRGGWSFLIAWHWGVTPGLCPCAALTNWWAGGSSKVGWIPLPLPLIRTWALVRTSAKPLSWPVTSLRACVGVWADAVVFRGGGGGAFSALPWWSISCWSNWIQCSRPRWRLSL